MNMTPKYARGGIGDLLLCLQSAIEAKEINVFSHYSRAPEIFLPFDIQVQRFDYFETLAALESFFIPGVPLSFHVHPVFKMPCLAPFEKNPNKKVIGIHIEGSQFSNHVWSERGMPTKNMTPTFMLRLAEEIHSYYENNVCLYFFCSPSRFDEINLFLHPLLDIPFRVIAYHNIWSSLACVTHCDHVIGMDSAIKTMSAMLSIPTTTLVGNFSDPFRDSVFLEPYQREGIMSVVKFSNIDDVNPSDIIEYIRI